ncbi:MAG: LD-carboxypeptidase [Paludibacteraceae bacterium]|nr:LD-carboxypeptidase [Paludibacteraceae bacterium]
MNIRIVSPSGAIDPEYIDLATQKLTSWGHRVVVGQNAKNHFGYFAGTANERTDDLNNAFADENTDIILCSRGGYGLQQIVDKVQIPHGCNKLVLGFSDITCLHLLLYKRNIPSLHSIMCKHISTLPENAEPILQLRKILSGEPVQYQLKTGTESRDGIAEGKIIGGNLSVFAGLIGTPYFPDFEENTILFLEDLCEPQYKIDRMLHQLRLAGVFSRIKGLIVGQFSDCDTREGFPTTITEHVASFTQPYSYPVWTDFPAGHVEDNRPLWFGKHCTVKIRNGIGNLKFE